MKTKTYAFQTPEARANLALTRLDRRVRKAVWAQETSAHNVSAHRDIKAVTYCAPLRMALAVAKQFKRVAVRRWVMTAEPNRRPVWATITVPLAANTGARS